MENFGIKYVGKEHAEHMRMALQTKYKITKDSSRSKYCRLTINWNYKKRTVDISMPGYVQAALDRFLYPSQNIHHTAGTHPTTDRRYN